MTQNIIFLLLMLAHVITFLIGLNVGKMKERSKILNLLIKQRQQRILLHEKFYLLRLKSKQYD